jgi:hypothetical protein
MRQLIINRINQIWTPGFEYEFLMDQEDVALLSDEELLELFIRITQHNVK